MESIPSEGNLDDGRIASYTSSPCLQARSASLPTAAEKTLHPQLRYAMSSTELGRCPNMKTAVNAVIAAQSPNRFWLPLNPFKRNSTKSFASCSSSKTTEFSKVVATHMAEIAFDCGTIPYCVIPPSAEPSVLCEQVIMPEWGLHMPKLILSIMGGAGNMQLDKQRFDADCFSKGLVEAALRTGAWVITGGTKSGVMDMVGKAMKQHDRRRQVHCVGILPFWGLTSRWREVLKESGGPRAKLDAAEETWPPEKDGVLTLAEIQDNHTHCIIVDNGKEGGETFGSENAFRAEFESFLVSAKNVEGQPVSKTLSNGSPVASTQDSQSPRVMILVNGGVYSLKALMEAIKHGCPIVLCEGTGRLSDLLCAVLRGVQEDEGQDIEELFRHAKETYMPNQMTDTDLEMAEFIIKSGIVEVYNNSERLEDVILRAVLETPSVQGGTRLVDIGRKVVLAVQWGCTDYFDMLGRQLVQECTAEQGPQGCNKAIEFVFRHVARGSLTAKVKDRQMEAKCCSVFVTWLMKTHHKQTMEFEVEKSNLGRIEWKHLGGGTRGLEGLLLWSIEREAPASVLEAIWMQMEDPVHSALIAAHASRETAWLQHSSSSFNDVLCNKELNHIADSFERLALVLLDDLAKTGKGVDFLFQEAKKWESTNSSCFHLAHQLGCKKFVASTFYSQAVDLFWLTPVPFHINKKRQLDQKHNNFTSIVRLLLKPHAAGDFTRWELLSIPAVKKITHQCAQLFFVVIYSYAVFYGQLSHAGIQPIQVVLFLWGVGQAKVEVGQYYDKHTCWDYCDFWNVLDCMTIVLMMGALVLGGLVLADANPETNDVEHGLEVIHAICVGISWIRLLFYLMLSQHFGTLLITIISMVKDALWFFILEVVICSAFSFALTPMIFPSVKEREEQGLDWAFWMILGEGNLEPLRGRAEKQQFALRLLIKVLLYALALLNMLLVNLLIAVMNSTYEQNQAASQTDMAFRRMVAVLEWAGEHKLPPPLNLLEAFVPDCRCEDDDQRPLARSSRTRFVDTGITDQDLKDSQQLALLAVSQEEHPGEAATLRAENAELRRRVGELGSRNAELERLAANFLLHEVSNPQAGPPATRTYSVRVPRQEVELS